MTTDEMLARLKKHLKMTQRYTAHMRAEDDDNRDEALSTYYWCEISKSEARERLLRDLIFEIEHPVALGSRCEIIKGVLAGERLTVTADEDGLHQVGNEIHCTFDREGETVPHRTPGVSVPLTTQWLVFDEVRFLE